MSDLNPKPENPFVSREGENVRADAAFDAWTPGDLNQMLKALSFRTNPIHRHVLLQNIVQQTYKLRSDSGMRAKCLEMAGLHLSEFPTIAPDLKGDLPSMPRVTTFVHLATVLTEDGEYDRAIEVCRMALRYGTNDGTKGGFEGRIARIEKKRSK